MFMSWKKNSLFAAAGIISLVLCCFLLTGWNEEKPKETVKVVLDPGHGGFDPGKVSVTGALEKDLNLAVAKKVKRFLEEQDIHVVMTRDGDEDLSEERKHGKKTADMKNRVQLIEREAPRCTVSIHQNSYTDGSVSGPQVFYYKTSTEGKALADKIQERLNEELSIERPRTSRENDTYYILKKSSSVTVLAECGFISNYKEAEQLESEEYQTKTAKAICEGILEYLR